MRYLTAGESHGKQLTTIVEGVPALMPLTSDEINESLLRRQKGHGRGKRMQIEKDLVDIAGGVRHGYTLGSPLALIVKNDDFKHWTDIIWTDLIECACISVCSTSIFNLLIRSVLFFHYKIFTSFRSTIKI